MTTNDKGGNHTGFNPCYPNHDSQAARLLAVALMGEKINPLRGWRNLGIYRLSDTKFRLLKMGWPMESGRLDVANICTHSALTVNAP